MTAATEVLCAEPVWRGDDWHASLCTNPAKWTVRLHGRTDYGGKSVCGVHVRRYRTAPQRFYVEVMS